MSLKVWAKSIPNFSVAGAVELEQATNFKRT
jgi:hypothetical protein